MLKKHKYFIILIAVVVFVSSYFVHYSYQLKYEMLSFDVVRLSSPVEEPSSSVEELEELRAKTVDWPDYKNKKYKIKLRYPLNWSYVDESSFPYGIAGELADYKATEIFSTNKPLDGPMDGAGMHIFYTNDLSKVPTKESIASDFKSKDWSVPPEINLFLLNGFEGAVATAEIVGEGRGQMGLASHIFNDRIYYVDWYLYEEYKYSKSDYSNITYQNQFLPLLATFEVEK